MSGPEPPAAIACTPEKPNSLCSTLLVVELPCRPKHPQRLHGSGGTACARALCAHVFGYCMCTCAIHVFLLAVGETVFLLTDPFHPCGNAAESRVAGTEQNDSHAEGAVCVCECLFVVRCGTCKTARVPKSSGGKTGSSSQ